MTLLWYPMRRLGLKAGLLLSAPCVLLLVALPVGFLMELGAQTRLRLVNRTGRDVAVTPVDASGAAALTLHPLLPLPALRVVDLPLAAGASRVVYFNGRRTALRALSVRESSGERRELVLPPSAAKRRAELVLDESALLVPAAAPLPPPVYFPWAVFLAGPLGSFAFFRFRRALAA